MDKITIDEIIDLASRYVPVDKADFPQEGELFYFLVRKLAENKVLKDDEGWMFSGYGQCRGYAIDEAARPRGKWLFMYYLDLSRFPPTDQALKVQPPHVVKGQFFSQDRTAEFRIVRYRETKTEEQTSGEKASDNIIEFPGNTDL
ncbi:hypothetical protein ACFL5V_05365 [Fibrobacterota bacterium]